MKINAKLIPTLLALCLVSFYSLNSYAQFGLPSGSPFSKKSEKEETKDEAEEQESAESASPFGGFGGLMGSSGGGTSRSSGNTESSGQSNMAGMMNLVGTATATQSDEEEIAAGDAVAAMYLGVAPLISNERTIAYVNAVGRRIASKSSRPDLPWSFGIIDTPSINAFAAPGGKILVTAGLFQLLETEDELAAVLGHEVAHVARKHHWELIKQQKLVSGMTDMVSANIDTGGGMAESVFGQMVGFFKDLATSGIDKGGEYQADLDGVLLAAKAGYDSTAMLGVLEKLSAASGSGGDVNLLYGTHPTAEQRTENVISNFSSDLEYAAVPSQYAGRIEQFQEG